MRAISAFFKDNKILFSAVIICLLLYFFLFSALVRSPFSHDPIDQYTRQAKAWTEGRTDLPEKLSYLELAEYNGKYYVSFPPVPSIVMLPLYLISGDETPNTLMNIVYMLLAFVVVCKMMERKVPKGRAALISFFFVFSSCALPLSMAGSVWFHAQLLAFTLVSAALMSATSEKRALWSWSVLFLALSVGCRPLNALYFVPVYTIIITNLKKAGAVQTADNRKFDIKQWVRPAIKYLWAPFVVMVCIMAYNYIRFDNPFVFGHKYLHNFSQDIKQFSFSHIKANVINTFSLPKLQDNALVFPKLDGFAFWLCCPFYIYAFVEFVFTKKKAIHYIALACFLVHFIAILCHKTMGGFQFGSRYLVDLLPYALIIIYYGKLRDRIYPYVLMAFGLMLNVYGTMYHFLGW